MVLDLNIGESQRNIGNDVLRNNLIHTCARTTGLEHSINYPYINILLDCLNKFCFLIPVKDKQL